MSDRLRAPAAEEVPEATVSPLPEEPPVALPSLSTDGLSPVHGVPRLDMTEPPAELITDEQVLLAQESFKPDADFPYELREQVGEGAMGVVYRAYEPTLDREVALKVIRGAFLDGLSVGEEQHALQRFLQEARSAARLNHPGVATIYRIGKTSTGAYIAMEWLDGQTLDQRLEQRDAGAALELPEVVSLAQVVLETLAVAHRLGIVHRDIKPGNIFLTRDGRIKVTDFGIARVRGSDLVQTQTGVFLGTPTYASPEQILGEKVDARSDLYAVGVILYEALSGRLPHSANDIFSLFAAVLDEPAEPLRTHTPTVPEHIERVVLRALEKEPAYRFQSATEMLEALRDAATEAGLLALPLSSLSVLGPPRARGPVVDAVSTTAHFPRRGVTRTMIVQASAPDAMVTQLVLSWPARQLGVRRWREVLERALSQPLTGAAFSGGIRICDTLLLVWNGLLFSALDVGGAVTRGDGPLERLPEQGPMALYRCPEGLCEGDRIVKHLASLMREPAADAAQVFSSLEADPGALLSELCEGGFDGVLRLRHAWSQAFVLLSRGELALELFSHDWPQALRDRAWEQPGQLEISVSIEPLSLDLPSFTWRRELCDLAFAVTPATDADGSARIEPQPGSATEHSSGTWRKQLRRLHRRDPVYAVQSWLFDALPRALQAPSRAPAWQALHASLGQVRRVLWHHALARPGLGQSDDFDLVTFCADGRALHVVQRASQGSRATLEAFVARVCAARKARPRGDELSAALFVAPSFSSDAMRWARGRVVPTAPPPWWARPWRRAPPASFVRDGDRGGFQLVLVEESERGLTARLRL